MKLWYKTLGNFVQSMNWTERLGLILPECIGNTFQPFKLNLHASIFTQGRIVQTKLIILFIIVDFHSQNGHSTLFPS